MKIAVENNSLYCPDINSRIHHMECNDECKFFCGCAIADQSFVIRCGWSHAESPMEEPVALQKDAEKNERVFSA
ncbi:MAG: hypothetical protein RBU23_10365 [Candidatus Auribacterota bacterium]|nr:hypothetical protein [Candidatus Auribacterota bacterium]